MSSYQLKSFWTAALGTLIEYYDMVLYIIFLPLLSPVLLGGNSSYDALIKGYAVLFVTMLARPLGAIFFGHWGDMVGRPKALLTSMYGIAIATFIIGIIPAYATIGPLAIVIVCLAKTVQVFCFGGEYSGAGIYVVEHAREKNEVVMGSLLSAVALLGSLLASLFAMIATLPHMPSWSWRIAFILGSLVGIIGIRSRKKMVESPHFIPANPQQDNLMMLIKKFPLEMITGIFVGGLATIPYTTVLTFINPMLMTNGYFNTHQLMMVQTVMILFSIVVLLIAGKIANKISAAKVMQFSCLLLIFSYVLFPFIDHGNFIEILLVSFSLITINEIFLAPSNAFYKNLFPMQYRYRGASLSFCIGMSLIGGLTPLIENYLYQTTQQFAAIFPWFFFNAFFGLICIAAVQKKRANSYQREKTQLISRVS